MADLAQPASPTASIALRVAGAADVERLRETMAEAFLEDPVLGWLVPSERRRLWSLRRFYDIELRHVGLAQGRVWTTAGLNGAAVTTPPHRWRVPPRVALLQATCGLRLGRAIRLLSAVERRHLREPHHYFAHIGVAPQAQGRGIGSALMGPTLERCDRQGLPAYLEASTERSAALYERLGFRLIEELRVGGSPALRLMRRPPSVMAMIGS